MQQDVNLFPSQSTTLTTTSLKNTVNYQLLWDSFELRAAQKYNKSNFVCLYVCNTLKANILQQTSTLDVHSTAQKYFVFTSSSLRMLHCTGVTWAETVDGILAASSFAAAFNLSNLREAMTTLQPVKKEGRKTF